MSDFLYGIANFKALEFSQKAHMPQINANNGDLGSLYQFSSPRNSPVSAQDNNNLSRFIDRMRIPAKLATIIMLNSRNCKSTSVLLPLRL